MEHRSYSNSYIQDYKTCPWKCFLRNEVRLEPQEEGTSEHHLAFGRAMHEALSLLYKGDSLEAIITAFKKEYPRQLDESDKAKTQENGVFALKKYVDRWREEDKKWRVISCETKERFEYGDEDAFTVKLDLVMENIS